MAMFEDLVIELVVAERLCDWSRLLLGRNASHIRARVRMRNAGETEF
jgi:hypothetical protein